MTMRSDPTLDLRRHWRTFSASIRPPARLSISEWAETHRVLTSDIAAEAGPWSNLKTPYLVEIMDALSPDDPCQKVVFMKSARIGGTEVMNNVLGAYVHGVKCPIMVVQPSEADAEEWSKDHLDGLIDATDSIRDLFAKVAGERTKGNTILHKKYRGGSIYIVGASTPKSFRRRTIRIILFDEVDGYPVELAGEGDPVSLGLNRLETFTFNKKAYLTSTPTVKGSSRIEAAYLDSDQRHFLVPCPECKHEQRLVWPRVRWSSRRDQQGFPLTVYVCESCEAEIPHHRKPWMLARGRWYATNPVHTTKGYHISSLYSPWTSWGQLAAEFLQKKDDPLQLQTFVNTKLGETWDAAHQDSWDTQTILGLVEPSGPLPSRVACLTAGVDVQDDRIVVQVDAWGPYEERWTVERRDLLGDPSGGQVWLQLEQALLHEYPCADGGVASVWAACIDTGGHHTLATYDFCRRHLRRHWLAIKGSGTEGRPLVPPKPSRKNKGKVPVHILGVSAGKEAVHARLRHSVTSMAGNTRGGPGYWHFMSGPSITAAYFDELTNEVCVTVGAKFNRGTARAQRRREWRIRNQSIRNEALDISVYSLAALQYLLQLRAVDLTVPLIPRLGSTPDSSPQMLEAPRAQAERDQKAIKSHAESDKAPKVAPEAPSQPPPSRPSPKKNDDTPARRFRPRYY